MTVTSIRVAYLCTAARSPQEEISDFFLEESRWLHTGYYQGCVIKKEHSDDFIVTLGEVIATFGYIK